MAVASAVHPEGGFLDIAPRDHAVVRFFVLEDREEDAGFVPAAFDRGEFDSALGLDESPVARDTVDADGVGVAVGEVLCEALGKVRIHVGCCWGGDVRIMVLDVNQ